MVDSNMVQLETATELGAQVALHAVPKGRCRMSRRHFRRRPCVSCGLSLWGERRQAEAAAAALADFDSRFAYVDLSSWVASVLGFCCPCLVGWLAGVRLLAARDPSRSGVVARM